MCSMAMVWRIEVCMTCFVAFCVGWTRFEACVEVSRELQSNSPSARMGLAGRSCQDYRVTVLYIYAGMVADLGYDE